MTIADVQREERNLGCRYEAQLSTLATAELR